MKSYKLHAIMIIIIFSFLSGVGTADDAAPKDDAYHYLKTGVDDQLYNELWRFNGADNNSQFMITFLLSDPENLTIFQKDSGAGSGSARRSSSSPGHPPEPGIWRRP